MNGELISLYAEIAAYQAEIEGMKAENKEREINGYSLAYTESEFHAISVELSRLAKAARMICVK